jgi:hypothetical protein
MLVSPSSTRPWSNVTSSCRSAPIREPRIVVAAARGEHEEEGLAAEHDADPPLAGGRLEAVDELAPHWTEPPLRHGSRREDADEAGWLHRQVAEQAVSGQYDEAGSSMFTR